MSGVFGIMARMRKILFVLLIALNIFSGRVLAQDATESANATGSAVATESAIVATDPEPKADLTQPTPEVKGKLARLIEEHPVGALSWNNFLRYFMERAVKQGVPANTLVLIILFPLAVTLVAASRHLIGIRGTGILTPALLAVAFLATGVWAGVILFGLTLAVTIVSRSLLKNFRLQYLPRVALLLWFVSAGVLSVMFVAGEWGYDNLTSIGIFPILILMLLAETFIDLQSGRSAGEARTLIVQTVGLAIITSLILGWEMVQRVVILAPEIIFFGLAVIDIFMGKYTGLRLSEYLLFGRVVKDDEEE
ncbi:MAG: hypothetical protein DPW11_01050 [bacterium]|nr:hypothetical protein [bacterium]RIK51297.1 MAG: hypothetical protein DCC61_02945 [Candidatus Microgenomates bacterium]